MRLTCLKAVALGSVSVLVGCSQPAVEVAPESLAFPVVLVTGIGGNGKMPCRADVVHARDHLSRMRLSLYSELSDRSLSGPPIVVDASAQIFEMHNIVGERGGLWMMANPNGMMPIRFSLIRRKDGGISPVRDLLAGCRFPGRVADDDTLTRRRNDIRKATAMAGIIAILDE
ncbi:MAG: hypothetical protein O9315_17915 [Beijerinckiaceae bacterium]|nr:hypothetical protein [Brevundimonas sp.]MCZ8302117.1 hypothetical protein [Beijerinckiaceae bacterium]